ncbi:MAG: hypothetical protein OEZ68_07675 [Gammaproteobacteria bacterium]|nr:hypothetical protein [Gammaproteobacteria bacterium]MDH5800664.1 hypothetical protein [Gammaproteobacteria bacterium]
MPAGQSDLVNLTKKYTENEISESEFVYERAKLLWASVKGIKTQDSKQLNGHFHQALANAENSAEYFLRDKDSSDKIRYAIFASTGLALLFFILGMVVGKNSVETLTSKPAIKEKAIEGTTGVAAISSPATAVSEQVPVINIAEQSEHSAKASSIPATHSTLSALENPVTPKNLSAKPLTKTADTVTTKPALPRKVSKVTKTTATGTTSPKLTALPKIKAVKVLQPAAATTAPQSKPEHRAATVVVQNTENHAAPQKNSTNVPVIKVTSPTVAESQQLISRFTAAYNAGNLDAFSAFLSPNVISNGEMGRNNILAEYKTLFETSVKRQMVIDNLTWTREDYKSIAKGNLSVSIQHKADAPATLYQGRIEFMITKDSNLIKQFNHYVVNEKMVDPIVIDAKTKPENNTAELPTPQELNSLVQNFIQSYENGNIQGLIQLFSENAQSGDSKGRNNIRNEYYQLFRTTSDRQINIYNLNWTFNKAGAIGNAQIDLTLQKQAKAPIEALQGDIRLVVEKSAGKSRIVKLEHSLN